MSEIDARRERQKHTGWIGVDFDGTLATYHTWGGHTVLGDPIMPMVDRVKRWLDEGYEVRIMTARALPPNSIPPGFEGDYAETLAAFQEWTIRHLGREIEITCVKDLHMIELWDDRAIQVVSNSGRTLAEEHAAELSALKGAP